MTRVRVPAPTGRYSNHRPEFRPTDEAALFAHERTVGKVVLEVMQQPIPAGLVTDGNEAAWARYTLARLDSSQQHLSDVSEALWRSWGLSEQDTVHATIAEVNRQLRGRTAILLSTVRKAEEQVPVWSTLEETFDSRDPQRPAAVYADRRARDVIGGLSAQQRETLERLLEDAFTMQRTWGTGRTTAGLTPQDRARAIFALLDELDVNAPGMATMNGQITRGLDPASARAVVNRGNEMAYRLIRQGRSADEAWRQVSREMERHADRARRSRARMIARTEISRANNAAIHSTHQRMIDEGLVSPDSEMEWVTGPYDVCPICTALGGSRVPVSGNFDTQTGLPPAHPSCRCKTRLVPTLSAPPRRIGEGPSPPPSPPWRS